MIADSNCPFIVVSPQLFSLEECAEMRRLAAKHVYTHADVLGENGGEARTFRRAEVSEDAPELYHMFFERALSFLTDCFVMRSGGRRPAYPEIQLTATGDGGFFRSHTDDGMPPTISRLLSYVFYFGEDYLGGDLLFNTSGFRLATAPGLLTVFDSALWHEVTETRIPYADVKPEALGRLTLNGWMS
jgi:Rps23 Pro-64 3,4-dihydroxylase Tpa1-like proline 4-hydroxylase